MTLITSTKPLPGGSSPIARVEMSEDELTIITNALNEVCNGLELPDFSTRIGAGRDEVLQLLRELTAFHESNVKVKNT